MPLLTCNNVQSEFSKYPFKLYTSSTGSQNKGYARNKVATGCADACKVQYNSCTSVYAQGNNLSKIKCRAQYDDCVFTNRSPNVSSKCKTFGN